MRISLCINIKRKCKLRVVFAHTVYERTRVSECVLVQWFIGTCVSSTIFSKTFQSQKSHLH